MQADAKNIVAGVVAPYGAFVVITPEVNAVAVVADSVTRNDVVVAGFHKYDTVIVAAGGIV